MKFLHHLQIPHCFRSLPVRERGLKYIDELDTRDLETVAPRAGAWIEIIDVLQMVQPDRSLPVRERGLKFYYYEDDEAKKSRSPCGSVD